MRFISNSTRSTSESETSRENRGVTDAFAGDEFAKNDSIKRANSIPIDQIIRYYGVNVNKYNKKAICPFKSHKGGRENSPSFILYPDTNSFNCFGCGRGGRAAEFVSIMDGVSKYEAAAKILEVFGDNFDENFYNESIFDQTNFSEQLDVMMAFSNEIREFYRTYIDNESREFIDNICETYDDICLKHKLNNEALRAIIEKYQRKINLYKACHQ